MEPFVGERVRVGEEDLSMPRAEPEPKTVDRLREDIDRGVTGDKVPGSDPAAAPLGTDDEAAGAPPTQAEIGLEARSRSVLSHAETSGGGRRRAWLAGAGVVVVLLVVLAIAWGS
jgi:hypothetical protein